MFFISDPSDTANLAQQQGLNEIRKPRCLLFRSPSSFVIPPAGMNFDSGGFGNLTQFFSQLLTAIWNKDKFSVDGKVLNLLTNKKKTDYFVNPVNFMVSSESIFFFIHFHRQVILLPSPKWRGLHLVPCVCFFETSQNFFLPRMLVCSVCLFVCLSVCFSHDFWPQFSGNHSEFFCV